MCDAFYQLNDAEKQDLARMCRIKQGDMEAFAQLIEAHQAKVIGTLVKMVGNASDAEEIAQQVFLRVWNSAARYEPTARFTTWLFIITRNLAFNELRRRKRRPERGSDPECEQRALQSMESQTESPSAVLIGEELEGVIQKAIEGLPDVQRMALILRRYEDLSNEEIGRILDLSVPAVKSILFRARVELRRRLRKYMGE